MSGEVTVPRGQLEAFLTDLCGVGFAVAKAPDLWSNLERGGDWDLVVLDVEEALCLLARRVGAPLDVVRRSYVTSANYRWGHIDFLPGIAWRGVQLAGASDVVEQAREQGGVPVASPPHQILAACVYPSLAHGSYRSRYRPLLTELSPEDRTTVEETLRQAFGQGIGLEDVLDPAAVRRVRRRGAVRSLRTLGGWGRWMLFLRREAALLPRRLRPPHPSGRSSRPGDGAGDHEDPRGPVPR